MDEWPKVPKVQMSTQCEPTAPSDARHARRSSESTEPIMGITMEQTFEMASVRSTGAESTLSHDGSRVDGYELADVLQGRRARR